MRVFLATLALLTLAACATPDAEPMPEAPPTPSAEAVPTVYPDSLPSVALAPEVARVLRDYEVAWRARDAAALAALFTADGFVMSGGRPAVRGRDAIRTRYTGSGGPLYLRAVHYAESGDLAYMIGMYRAQEQGRDTGKFTLTLRREAGRWLIVSDMDNGNG